MLGFFLSKNISYFPHRTFFAYFIKANSAFILEPEPSGTFLSGAAVSGRSAVGVGQIPVTLLRRRDRPGPVLPNPKVLLTGAESQRPVFDSNVRAMFRRPLQFVVRNLVNVTAARAAGGKVKHPVLVANARSRAV